MADSDQNQQNPGGNSQPDNKLEVSENPAAKSRRKFIIIVVVLFLAIAAGFFYWRSTLTEDTDDAQVDGDLYQVSARVSGQVVKVYITDNQKVQEGDPIVDIDPSDYKVALEQAEAQLANAKAGSFKPAAMCPLPACRHARRSLPPAPM